MIDFPNWKNPRRVLVKMVLPSGTFGNEENRFPIHRQLGISALSCYRAMVAAQKVYPDAEIQAVNITGDIDIIVDAPGDAL